MLVWVVLALSELLEAFVGRMSSTLHSLHPLHTVHSLRALHPRPSRTATRATRLSSAGEVGCEPLPWKFGLPARADALLGDDAPATRQRQTDGRTARCERLTTHKRSGVDAHVVRVVHASHAAAHAHVSHVAAATAAIHHHCGRVYSSCET